MSSNSGWPTGRKEHRNQWVRTQCSSAPGCTQLPQGGGRGVVATALYGEKHTVSSVGALGMVKTMPCSSQSYTQLCLLGRKSHSWIWGTSDQAWGKA